MTIIYFRKHDVTKQKKNPFLIVIPYSVGYNGCVMWKHNKVGIIALLTGMALLGAVYTYLHPQDAVLADRVASAGFCALLFTVGLASFLTARK